MSLSTCSNLRVTPKSILRGTFPGHLQTRAECQETNRALCTLPAAVEQGGILPHRCNSPTTNTRFLRSA